MAGNFENISGIVNHPSRECYMRLAAHCINAVNEIKDECLKISNTRKAMIHFGLVKDVGCIWYKEHLFKNLRELAKKYAASFNGLYPDNYNVEDDT